MKTIQFLIWNIEQEVQSYNSYNSSLLNLRFLLKSSLAVLVVNMITNNKCPLNRLKTSSSSPFFADDCNKVRVFIKNHPFKIVLKTITSHLRALESFEGCIFVEGLVWVLTSVNCQPKFSRDACQFQEVKLCMYTFLMLCILPCLIVIWWHFIWFWLWAKRV